MAGVSREVALDGMSIVLLGNFNPPIFQPLWFSQYNLIREEEAKSAEAEIIHKQVAILPLRWCSIQATTGRFTVETEDAASWYPLRDLISGTFEVLEHTPVNAFGLNRRQHVRLDSAAEVSRLVEAVSPAAVWQSEMTNPKIASVKIEGRSDALPHAQVNVMFEPSRRVVPGIYLHINCHYDIEADASIEPPDRLRWFVEHLKSRAFDQFIEYTSKFWQTLIRTAFHES